MATFSEDEDCPPRSRANGQPLPHLWTSHETVTDLDTGTVLRDSDICSWCTIGRDGKVFSS